MREYEPPVSLLSSSKAGLAIFVPLRSDSLKQSVCKCWSHLKASSKKSGVFVLKLRPFLLAGYLSEAFMNWSMQADDIFGLAVKRRILQGSILESWMPCRRLSAPCTKRLQFSACKTSKRVRLILECRLGFFKCCNCAIKCLNGCQTFERIRVA